jgi:hypothetical protein
VSYSGAPADFASRDLTTDRHRPPASRARARALRRAMAKLLVSTAGAAVLWAGGIAINAGLSRFSNERIAGTAHAAPRSFLSADARALTRSQARPHAGQAADRL